MKLFLERYGDILNEICGDIDSRHNDGLLGVMDEFAEPTLIYPNRYDNFSIKSTAFDDALNEFNGKMNTNCHMGTKWNVFGNSPDTDSLSVQPISYIFSIIELQYMILSEQEKKDFSDEINGVLSEENLPWRILDGKMIKIDSKQFESDLKEKTLKVMEQLKDVEPKFQSAYIELVDAMEAYEKGDYQSAINNAGKSYESVLKVILGADKGNASKLAAQYASQVLTVPDTMKKDGFKESVMMSLPFIRNNSGADHGAGAKQVVISKAMANLAINLASALNTYLIEEYVVNSNN